MERIPERPDEPRTAQLLGRAEDRDNTTPFQRALVAAIELDRDELAVLGEHITTRLIWLARWDDAAA
jgi:hypothetical protein